MAGFLEVPRWRTTLPPKDCYNLILDEPHAIPHVLPALLLPCAGVDAAGKVIWQLEIIWHLIGFIAAS